jgi:membrane-bound lytic murein transglycosylase D
MCSVPAFLLISALMAAPSVAAEARGSSVSEGAPIKERPAAGPFARQKQARKAKKAAVQQTKQRQDILDDLRCQGEDPSTCFVEPDFSLDAPDQRRARDADIDALLREVLAGLSAHEGEKIREAVAELDAEAAQEVDYFGAADHLMHPSTDLYSNPKKGYLDRPDLMLSQIDPRDFDYPIVVNNRVQNWMVYFLTRGRSWFTKWIARKDRYAPLILPKLEEAGLPKNLIYQAMIESGFNPYATSHASAVGVWQFIKSTGRGYGLQRDWWVDERRDPVMATRAAIAFMGDLYKRFGDWKLASAAYNAGGGKISRASKMYSTMDFWEMSSDSYSYLKPETKNYVPKIIAAAILGTYADRYGLTAEIKDEHRLSPWDYDIVTVSEATDLAVVSKITGTPVEELESMNPALRRGYTPPGVQNYPLNVPKGEGKRFAKEFAKIPESERVTFVRYTIRKGDTLGKIAGKYSVPVSMVQRMNGINDPRRIKVGRSLLIPVRATELGARTVTHMVAKGESLSIIAKKYDTSTQAIRDGNKLKSDVLKVGQRLKVASKGNAVASKSGNKSSSSTSVSSKSSAAPVKSAAKTTWHTVRSGDSLYKVASANGLSVDGLRTLNKLNKKSVIHPGDKLRLRADPPPPTRSTYTVSKGDTLSGIANRHNMSTSQLKKLNGLKSDTIGVGQKLKVLSVSKSVKHKVASGDTLYEIARKYSVSVESIKRSNALSGNTIQPGQTLKISSDGKASAASKSIAYQVMSGDTLSGISAKYGVTVAQIKSWNGLNGDSIRPGQKLKVELH